MLKNIAILFLLLLQSIPVFSQNETANWYFGNGAGISFKNGIRTVLDDGAMVAPAGCSSISDNDGNLLFYTNGKTVWNKTHQVMVNGNGLSGTIEQLHNSIIIPNPENESIYYIITTRKQLGNTFAPGIYYSTVEFTNQYPLGHITEKNIRLVRTASERITAIYLPDQNTYKVITFGQAPYEIAFGAPPPQEIILDTFCFFNVTGLGVSLSSSTSIENEVISNTGAMKISPNGQHLALADNGQNFILVYNIDTASESLTFKQFINTGLFGNPYIYPYGLEFSPDSQLVYFSSHSGNYSMLFQFEINSTEDAIDKTFLSSNSSHKYGALQLAIDGKIYVAKYALDGSSINSLGVVNKPNEPGANECEFNAQSVNLDPNGGLKGLPIFVQSYFESRIITEDRCVSNTFDFQVDSYSLVQSAFWEFGDGNTSTLLNPSHQFSTSGEYIVKATIEVNGKFIDLYKRIEVYPLPNAAPGLTMTQCDPDHDSIAFFNLYGFASNIEDYQTTDFELSFFHSYSDAENAINPIANPEAYENSTNLEEVFVRIVSPEGCVAVSNFFLEANYALLDNISNMYVCELPNDDSAISEGRFDLRPKKDEIRDQFNLPETATITFYASLQDAQTQTNPINTAYVTETTTIWFRVDNGSEDCGGIGPIALFVNTGLEVNLEEHYIICDPTLQASTVLNGGSSNDSWLWEDQQGNVISTQQYFPLTQEGTYSLTVEKTENGLTCSITKEFTATQALPPVFDTIKAGDYRVFVSVVGDSSYEFSLNGTNFFGQGTEHTFHNTDPGIYTIYVRDSNNCSATITTQISFIGLPKYFTPNGDNYNDVWRVEGISSELYSSAYINIFDRYGKTLYSMDLNSNTYGWNGTYQGRALETSDYWYTVVLVDNEMKTSEISGHFSLLR